LVGLASGLGDLGLDVKGLGGSVDEDCDELVRSVNSGCFQVREELSECRVELLRLFDHLDHVLRRLQDRVNDLDGERVRRGKEGTRK